MSALRAAEHGADHVTASVAIEWTTRTACGNLDEVYQAGG